MQDFGVPQKTKDDQTSVPTLITTALAVAGFAFIYLTQREQLSAIEQILFGILLLFILAVFIYWVWSPGFGRLFARIRGNRVAGRNFKEFVLFVEEFKETYTRVSPNIATLLTDLRTRSGGGDFAKIPNANPMHVDWICDSFLTGLKLMRHDQATLSWATATFASILRMFNDGLIAPAVNEARTISDKVGVPRDIKEAYNTSRLKYIHFLDRYEGYIVRVNKEFGPPPKNLSRIAASIYAPLRHPYIERPKEL